jgi:hypothetical protein
MFLLLGREPYCQKSNASENAEPAFPTFHTPKGGVQSCDPNPNWPASFLPFIKYSLPKLSDGQALQGVFSAIGGSSSN